MKSMCSFAVLIVLASFFASVLSQTPSPPLSPTSQRDAIIRNIGSKCCQMGREAMKDNCEGYTPSPQYDIAWNNFCRMEYQKCCSAAIARDSCEHGRKSALSGRDCAKLMIAHPMRIFQWHCCEACYAGISKGESVSSVEECNWSVQTERLEDLSVTECCSQTVRKNKSNQQIASPADDDKNNGPQDDSQNQCAQCEHSCEPDESNTKRCTCRDGYSLAEDGAKCIDVDECSLLPPVCNESSVCVNKEGSFECTVQDLLPSASGQAPVSEVSDTESPTTAASTVSVQPVSEERSGKLEQGTEGEPRVTEVAEVAETPEEVVTTPKVPVSTRPPVCDMGYRYSSEEEECIDIDECAENNHDCKPEEKCINDDGGFNCKSVACEKGHSYNEEQEICLDIDECEEAKVKNETICKDHQICINFEGGFRCETECPSGTRSVSSWFGHRCEDIDECLLQKHDCVEPHECHNTEGSYECKCKAGYEEDPISQHCVDVNECKFDDPAVCDRSAVCHNTPGSYECRCLEGFLETEIGTCVDIDECEDPAPCPPDSRCKNTPGHYECSCLANFKLNDNHTKCISEEPCHGIQEGDECTCPQGFKLVHDRTCHDQNECDDLTSPCGHDEMCLNLFGTYKCLPTQCPEHYKQSKSDRDHPKCIIEGYAECLDGDLEKCRELIDTQTESFSVDYHAVSLEPGHMTEIPVYVTKNLELLEIKFDTEPAKMKTSFEVRKDNAVYLRKSLGPLSNVNMTVSLVSHVSEKIIHKSIVYIFVSEKNAQQLLEELKSAQGKAN